MNVTVTEAQRSLMADGKSHGFVCESDDSGRWRLVVDNEVGPWAPWADGPPANLVGERALLLEYAMWYAQQPEHYYSQDMNVGAFLKQRADAVQSWSSAAVQPDIPLIDIRIPPPVRFSWEPALDRLTVAAERLADRLAPAPQAESSTPSPTATTARLRAAAAALCDEAASTPLDLGSVVVRRQTVDALRAAAKAGT